LLLRRAGTVVRSLLRNGIPPRLLAAVGLVVLGEDPELAGGGELATLGPLRYLRIRIGAWAWAVGSSLLAARSRRSKLCGRLLQRHLCGSDDAFGMSENWLDPV
jgi:hypothetical protein